MLKPLVASHGAVEVQRRIGILFDGHGPEFLRAPFDLGTFVKFFDKLAAPTAPPRGFGGARAGPNSDPRYGRIEPHPPEEYPDGEVKI